MINRLEGKETNKDVLLAYVPYIVYLMKKQPTNFQHQNLSITKGST